MKTRYSGKSFKDSSTMKKSKLSFREKRKIKREKKKNKVQQKNYGVVQALRIIYFYAFIFLYWTVMIAGPLT